MVLPYPITLGDDESVLHLRGVVCGSPQMHALVCDLLVRGRNVTVDCDDVEGLEDPALDLLAALADALRMQSRGLRMVVSSNNVAHAIRRHGMAHLLQQDGPAT